MLVPYNVDVPMERLPFANWALIGATCLISIVVLVGWDPDRADRELERQLERAVQRNDQKEIERLERKLEEEGEPTVPPLSLRWDRGVPAWLFTYQFVHADFWHLAGNMLFLFVFGNAVNAKLGHWQFLVAYLLLGALAGLAFLPLSRGHPIVGASGSIMGVVGLFVVLFPRNDVQIFYWFSLIWAGVTRIAAYWVVLFFVLGDLIGAVLEHSGPVAYAAHLVGAAGGFALGVALVKSRRVRSTRYEENILECFGYQRKDEPRRRKEKKAARPRKDRRTVAELLADGSDSDLCAGMFRRVLRRNDGEVSATGLGTEERVVLLVWHSLRFVNEIGFRALVEEGIDGDRKLERTAEAYQTIGCVRAGNALLKASAVLRGAGKEYAEERAERSVRRWVGLPAAEEKKFLEVSDEVEGRLAEYVRSHREFFLALDDEE
ncbi:MAG TPA: rhomboid family intramembrane serine protease [Gemmataceae bacterium]|nr:rhomboid family intramembrane serine protease [Gemmataceae bacterium]